MHTTIRQDSNLTGCICLIGMVFGAIHCAGWNFLFPSHAELILWRISSLVITAVPLSIASADFYFTRMPDQTSNFVEQVWRGPIDFIITCGISVCILMYILARFTLLAEAFVALRDLSPSTLAVVRWTSFLPHI
ncbi:hypothetical protein BDZ97DRAFT_1664036 [Flammula alnicola]|nr:hypothetical protein BDZ97DRAFT_1664036 [Flammula alnicola]